jgi:hypothetical protein
MLGMIMLSVNMLGIVILSVVMLSVVAPIKNDRFYPFLLNGGEKRGLT